MSSKRVSCLSVPTKLFTILEPQKPSLHELYSIESPTLSSYLCKSVQSGRVKLVVASCPTPDRPFHNFRAFKSVGPRTLCIPDPSIDGWPGSKIVKWSVGHASSKQCQCDTSSKSNCRKISCPTDRPFRILKPLKSFNREFYTT